MVAAGIVQVLIWPFAAAVTAYAILQAPFAGMRRGWLSSKNICLLLMVNGIVSLASVLPALSGGAQLVARGVPTESAGTLSYGVSFLVAGIVGYLLERRKDAGE